MRKFPSRKKLAKMDPLDRCADAIVRLRKAKSHRDAMLHFLTLRTMSRELPAPVAECFGIEAGMALARKYPDECHDASCQPGSATRNATGRNPALTPRGPLLSLPNRSPGPARGPYSVLGVTS